MLRPPFTVAPPVFFLVGLRKSALRCLLFRTFFLFLSFSSEFGASLFFLFPFGSFFSSLHAYHHRLLFFDSLLGRGRLFFLFSVRRPLVYALTSLFSF